MNVGQSALTKRNIEVLEAVFHAGNPYLKKVGPVEQPKFIHMGALQSAGGAVYRMIEEIKRRGYITTDSVPSTLTVKGLRALERDKVAMKAIDEREMAGRITKAERIESEDKEAAERVRLEREARAKERTEESKIERLKRLHELLDPMDAQVFSKMGDDELLNLADQIASIELVY